MIAAKFFGFQMARRREDLGPEEIARRLFEEEEELLEIQGTGV
jgi:hypothetical protein